MLRVMGPQKFFVLSVPWSCVRAVLVSDPTAFPSVLPVCPAASFTPCSERYSHEGLWSMAAVQRKSGCAERQGERQEMRDERWEAEREEGTGGILCRWETRDGRWLRERMKRSGTLHDAR